jgi:hypothetical protein
MQKSRLRAAFLRFMWGCFLGKHPHAPAKPFKQKEKRIAALVVLYRLCGCAFCSRKPLNCGKDFEGGVGETFAKVSPKKSLLIFVHFCVLRQLTRARAKILVK